MILWSSITKELDMLLSPYLESLYLMMNCIYSPLYQDHCPLSMFNFWENIVTPCELWVWKAYRALYNISQHSSTLISGWYCTILYYCYIYWHISLTYFTLGYIAFSLYVKIFCPLQCPQFILLNIHFVTYLNFTSNCILWLAFALCFSYVLLFWFAL